MPNRYPPDRFLEDWNILKNRSDLDSIQRCLFVTCPDQDLFPFRFKVFCRTRVIVAGYCMDMDSPDLLHSHSGHTHDEIMTAVMRSVHLLVCRNIDKDLSYEPSWDEISLMARWFLPRKG